MIETCETCRGVDDGHCPTCSRDLTVPGGKLALLKAEVIRIKVEGRATKPAFPCHFGQPCSCNQR